MGKCISVDFQESIGVCEVKVGTYNQINEYMTIYDNPRSWSFIDLCPRSLRFSIFRFPFLKKSLACLKPNFIWSLSGMLGWKFVQLFRVTWLRWFPAPYMVKTFKNLFQNQEADDIETWYTASSAHVLSNLFKWWHWVDLGHFYDMVKFVT